VLAENVLQLILGQRLPDPIIRADHRLGSDERIVDCFFSRLRDCGKKWIHFPVGQSLNRDDLWRIRPFCVLSTVEPPNIMSDQSVRDPEPSRAPALQAMFPKGF
jgi:hypothetical protein